PPGPFRPLGSPGANRCSAMWSRHCGLDGDRRRGFPPNGKWLRPEPFGVRRRGAATLARKRHPVSVPTSSTPAKVRKEMLAGVSGGERGGQKISHKQVVDRLRHSKRGNGLPWLKANEKALGFAYRTAQRLLEIANVAFGFNLGESPRETFPKPSFYGIPIRLT